MMGDDASLDDRSPLVNLAYEASQLCSGRAVSMMLEYFQQDRLWSDCYDDITALNQLQDCLIVMPAYVIVVHCTRRAAAASGLFGLLGDAPVQVVAAGDRETVEAYYALAEAYEAGRAVSSRQDFERPHVEVLQTELRLRMYE